MKCEFDLTVTDVECSEDPIYLLTSKSGRTVTCCSNAARQLEGYAQEARAKGRIGIPTLTRL